MLERSLNKGCCSSDIYCLDRTRGGPATTVEDRGPFSSSTRCQTGDTDSLPVSFLRMEVFQDSFFSRLTPKCPFLDVVMTRFEKMTEWQLKARRVELSLGGRDSTISAGARKRVLVRGMGALETLPRPREHDPWKGRMGNRAFCGASA